MERSLRFESGALLRAGAVAAWPELAVIGAPIEQSRSPILHGAALRALGLSHRYERIHVEASDLRAFLAAASGAGMRGLNLTAPHKQAVLSAPVRAAEEALRVRAANTLVRRGSEWVGHNTDLRGFALALQRWRGRSLEATLREVLVLGAGGAARAVCAALEDLGVRRLRLSARRPEAAMWAAHHVDAVELLAGLELGEATLVVQCTPLGWRVEDPSPLAHCHWQGAAAFDLTYPQLPSALVRQARAAGADAEDGRSMLVAQAALAFTMWFGGESPLQVMAASLGLDWTSASDASGRADPPAR